MTERKKELSSVYGGKMFKARSMRWEFRGKQNTRKKERALLDAAAGEPWE